jgi:hypothetical protein
LSSWPPPPVPSPGSLVFEHGSLVFEHKSRGRRTRVTFPRPRVNLTFYPPAGPFGKFRRGVPKKAEASPPRLRNMAGEVPRRPKSSVVVVVVMVTRAAGGRCPPRSADPFSGPPARGPVGRTPGPPAGSAGKLPALRPCRAVAVGAFEKLCPGAARGAVLSRNYSGAATFVRPVFFIFSGSGKRLFLRPAEAVRARLVLRVGTASVRPSYCFRAVRETPVPLTRGGQGNACSLGPRG